MWPSTSSPAVPSYDAQEERVKLVDYLQVCICMCVCVVQVWFVCMYACMSIYSSGCISQSKHTLRNDILTFILILMYAPNMQSPPSHSTPSYTQDLKTGCYRAIIEEVASARPGVLELMDAAIADPRLKVRNLIF